MKPANYAPVYSALYPELAEIARKHGYALAVHGSLARDMDVICIPWIDVPSEPQAVVSQITTEFDIRQIGEPATRQHGRIVYTISIGHGSCALDLSFMPRETADERQAKIVAYATELMEALTFPDGKIALRSLIKDITRGDWKPKPDRNETEGGQ